MLVLLMGFVRLFRVLGPQCLETVLEVVFQLFFGDRVLMIHISLGEAAPDEIGDFFLGKLSVFIRVGLSEENIDPPLAGMPSLSESTEMVMPTDAALHARTSRVERAMEGEPSMNPEPAMMVSHKSPIAAKAMPEFVSAPKLMPASKPISTMVRPTTASSVADSCPAMPAMMPAAASVKPCPSPVVAAPEVMPAEMVSRPVTRPFVSVAAPKTESAPLATEVMATAMFGPACRHTTARMLTPDPFMVAVTRISLAFALHSPYPAARSARGTLSRPAITTLCNLFAASEISSTTTTGPRSVIGLTTIGKFLAWTPTFAASVGIVSVAIVSVATSLVPVVGAQIASDFTSLVIQLIRAQFVRRRAPFHARRELCQTGCRDSAQKKQHIVPHD